MVDRITERRDQSIDLSVEMIFARVVIDHEIGAPALFFDGPLGIFAGGQHLVGPAA